MSNPIWFLSNRIGIPRIATDSVTENATDVIFNTTATREFWNNYNGLILFKMTQTLDAASNTLPISIQSLAGKQQFTVLGGLNWTGADYLPGIHLAYYESSSNLLQIIV